MDQDSLEQRHDRLQKFIFFGVAIGSTGFALQELLHMLGGNPPVHVALTVASLAGWIFACWAMYSTSSLVKEKGLEKILQDERLRTLRYKAFEFGFASLLTVQILLMVSNDFLNKFTDVQLTVSFAANLSIAVALMSSFGRFVYLNR